MKRVAHIHIPRNAGMMMREWGASHSPNYQFLYHRARSIIVPEFDPNAQWTYVGHHYIGDLLDKGVVTQDWWNGVFKFAFVRNTYSRLVSLFEYERSRAFRRRRPNWTDVYLLHFHDYIRYVTSEKYSRLMPRGGTLWPFFWNRQLPWLDRGVDFIGRFERLDEDWKKLCGIVGMKYRRLDHRNKPPTHLDLRKRLIDGWRGYYTDELRRLVAEFFADEIEQFNFRFEEE